MFKILIVTVFVSLSLAAVEFKSNSIQFNSNVGDNSAKFVIEAKNNGQFSESIDSIDGGCSCVSFVPSRPTIKPGESVAIIGELDFHYSSGKQRKVIKIHSFITTDSTKKEENEYRIVLEGVIQSPIKIDKSALIWLDKGNIVAKEFNVSLKNGFLVNSISCVVMNDSKSIFSLEYPNSGKVGEGRYVVKITDTNLKQSSDSMKDYFSSVNVTYKLTLDGVEKTRTERVDLLLAKDPKNLK